MIRAIIEYVGGLSYLIEIGPSNVKFEDKLSMYTVDIFVVNSTTRAVDENMLHRIPGQIAFDAVEWLKEVIWTESPALRVKDLRVVNLPASLKEVGQAISFNLSLAPPQVPMEQVAGIFLWYFARDVNPGQDLNQIIKYLPENMPFLPTTA